MTDERPWYLNEDGKWRLFLDDERFPPNTPEWYGDHVFIARSCEEAIVWIEDCEMGCPSFISFDHDLGVDPKTHEVRKTGYDFVNWLIRRDVESYDSGNFFIPRDFEFEVHSMNPVGAKNIRDALNAYLGRRT